MLSGGQVMSEMMAEQGRACWPNRARHTYFHKPKAHAQEAFNRLTILVKARRKACMQNQAVQAHPQGWDKALPGDRTLQPCLPATRVQLSLGG